MLNIDYPDRSIAYCDLPSIQTCFLVRDISSIVYMSHPSSPTHPLLLYIPPSFPTLHPLIS